MMLPNDEIEIRPWVKRGSMLVRSDALKANDPDHVYNQIKALGKEPEDYGIDHPLAPIIEKRFGNKTHNELCLEILELEKNIRALERHMAGC